MGDEKNTNRFDAFLKRNAPPVPPAPRGEKQRIWAEIERIESPWWARLISLPQIRVALPLAMALVVVLFVVQQKKLRRDRHIEQVLSSALAYQMEEDEWLF